jgi:hypothetical protein
MSSPTWKRKDGSRVPISEMDNAYLYSCLMQTRHMITSNRRRKTLDQPQLEWIARMEETLKHLDAEFKRRMVNGTIDIQSLGSPVPVPSSPRSRKP